MTETIKQIHAEFDSAPERMLEEAKRIINGHETEKMRKAERVCRLGFISSIAAKNGDRIIARYNHSQEVLKNMEYFSFHYPHNKFITEKEVKRICEKYSLVLGEAARYIGDIPEKNIEEIERFILREQDFFEELPTFYWDGMIEPVKTRWINWKLPADAQYNFGVKNAKHQKPAFMIVASYKDFDTSYTQLKGHKLEFHIPDPIVLQPVKGGYLIVSKWGPEASDESLVNEALN